MRSSNHSCQAPQQRINAGVASSISGLQDLQFLRPNVDFPNSVESGKTKDDDLTWTVRLAFDMTDSINGYVSAATGFKASSWNLSRDSRPFPSDQAALEAAGLTVPNLTYTTRYALPEEATVYEIGLKARWDTVALNMAIFDQSIKNFQENIFTGTGFNLQNAGEQSAQGAGNRCALVANRRVPGDVCRNLHGPGLRFLRKRRKCRSGDV